MRRQVTTPAYKAQAVRWQRRIRCCRHHDGPLIGSLAWLWFILGMIALVLFTCWLGG